VLYVTYVSLFLGLGSNNSSLATVESSGQQQQLLQNPVSDNTPGPSESANSLQNSSLVNGILGTIHGNSSLDTNNVILLNAETSCNILDDAEGQAVGTSVLSENGDSSGDSSRTVSMERSGLRCVNTSVRGIFLKNEPLDGGAESGNAAGTSGGITKSTGSNGE
jgi:hypothetical protein